MGCRTDTAPASITHTPHIDVARTAKQTQPKGEIANICRRLHGHSPPSRPAPGWKVAGASFSPTRPFWASESTVAGIKYHTRDRGERTPALILCTQVARRRNARLCKTTILCRPVSAVQGVCWWRVGAHLSDRSKDAPTSRGIRNDAASLSCGTSSSHAPTRSKISTCGLRY